MPREAGLGASGNSQVSWRRGLLHAAFAYCKAHTTFSFLQCFSSVKNCLEVICVSNLGRNRKRATEKLLERLLTKYTPPSKKWGRARFI